MQEIIERAIDNEEFRKKLFENSDLVAKEYNLDGEQSKLLKNLNRVNFNQFVGDTCVDAVRLGW